MSRYIDADALMQDINNSIDGMTTAGFTVDAEFLWGKLHDALEHAPSIDICFCKDCKEYNAGFECIKEGYGIEYPPMWFCADGKQRDSEKPNNSKERSSEWKSCGRK